VLLLAPALVLYLYGPRQDRPPDWDWDRRDPRAQGAGLGGLVRRLHGLRPRYRVRPSALWLALVPAGLGAYLAYLGLAGGDALLPFHAQSVSWSRHFVTPLGGAWEGLRAGWDGVRQLLSGQRHHVYFTPTLGSPLVAAGHNVMGLAFLALALPALVGVWRRLPAAYSVYVLAALALPLSSPVPWQPLMSLPRFELVLFPLSMWWAVWLATRRRLATVALIASAVLLAVFVAQFCTWHWVA
jgi:hypothetical protein